MAQTGCGDSPVDTSPSISTEIKDKEHEVHNPGRNKNEPDLISKVAKLESQIEDVTSTLKEEQENRRLIQHELEASRSLCQHLKELLKNQNASSSKQEQGIQTGASVEYKSKNDDRKDCNQRQVVECDSSIRCRQDLGKYSTASHLLDEYRANQEILESQVRKLSQECAVRDVELSKVGEKYALVMKKNVHLETEVESLRAQLGKQRQKLESHENLLKESDADLKQKVIEISGLQAQKDALAGKYAKVRRKVAQLKAVVVSFNKTVSEFRKEREQLLNKVAAPQGRRESEEDSPDACDDDPEVGEMLPSLSEPDSRPHSGYADSSGEQVQFDRFTRVSSKPAGWYSGISPEAEHYLEASWTSDGVSSHHEKREVSYSQRKIASEWSNHDKHAVSEHQHYSRGSERSTLQGFENRDGSGDDNGDDDDDENEEMGQSDLSSSSDCQEETSEHQFGGGGYEDEDHFCHREFFQRKVKTGHSGRHAFHGNVNDTSQNFKGATHQTSARADSAEGLLLVKHDMENYALRATYRSWHYVYIVHKGSRVWFYENRDFVSLGLTVDAMEPLDLSGAIICPLRDYVKRRHVFCIQLTCGARYLFQAKDDRDMLFWICRLSAGTGDVRSEQDFLFTQMKAPQRGSPSRTDRIKNFIRGSLSGVMK